MTIHRSALLVAVASLIAGWLGVYLTIQTYGGTLEAQTGIVLAAFAIAYGVIAMGGVLNASGVGWARWIVLLAAAPTVIVNQLSVGLILLLPGSWLGAIAAGVALTVRRRGSAKR